MNRAAMRAVALCIQQAETGVDYSPRHGAACPACGQKMGIVKTMPWQDNVRIRYHKCVNPACMLAMLGKSIKSVQADA